MQRYFINQEFKEKLIINSPDICHHMNNVMRYKIGTSICLVNNGIAKIYSIKSIKITQVEFEYIETINQNPELKNKITLAMPFLKKDNFSLALQKTTECGVNEIIPTEYEYNVIKYDNNKFEKKRERFEKIILGASMQSKRKLIPKLLQIQKLTSINFTKYDLVIVCYENEENKILQDLDIQIKNSQNILLIIGPEGGLHPKEITLLNNLNNSEIVSIGNRILRSETAQIAVIFYLSTIIEKEKNENSN